MNEMNDVARLPTMVMQQMPPEAVKASDDTNKLDFAIELLEKDTRPSFIVDLNQCDAYRITHMPVVYSNPSLSLHHDLHRLIFEPYAEAVANSDSVRFRYWVTRVACESSGIGTSASLTCYAATWTVVHLDPSYLIVSGLTEQMIRDSHSHQIDVADAGPHVLDLDSARVTPSETSTPLVKLHDEPAENEPAIVNAARWPNQGLLKIPRTPFIDLFHNVDWSQTSLGSAANWPDEFHVLCTLVMVDPQPALVYLGDEMLAIHNGPAVEFFPQLKDHFMGKTLKKTMPEVWNALSPIIENVRTGHTEQLNNLPYLMSRDGRLDECYVDSRYMPVLDKKGACLGVYVSFRDVTSQNLSRRRLATLLEVSSCASNITKVKEYWARLLEALTTNRQDVGFALLYSFDDSTRDSSEISLAKRQQLCRLEGTLGVVAGHVSIEESIDLSVDTGGFSDGLRQALEIDAPVLLHLNDGNLPTDLLIGLKCRAYSAPYHGAVICPIRPTGTKRVTGFLVMGISSRVACNSDFRQFIDILNRQIATSMASVTLFSEQMARERTRAAEAARVHAQLQERLAEKTQELLTSETKFQKLIDKTPVGVTITNSAGSLLYANQAFYHITNHPGLDDSSASWISLLNEDDVPMAIQQFTHAWETGEDINFEIRMKKEWTRKVEGAESVSLPTYLLASAYIEKDGTGRPMTLVSALTDISAQKWAEQDQHRRMVEALKLKKDQESFMDTISHEMRNPLSAVLQSATEVLEYLTRGRKTSSTVDEYLQNSIEAVEIIIMCCQHQRGVIDDVLTLSKMNSGMLPIVPRLTDPEVVVRDAVRMLSADARKHEIAFTVAIEDSLAKMGIGSLLFDPNRLSQILVNILGNAIKFTRDCPERRIKVLLGTSLSRPLSNDCEVEYLESKINFEQSDNGADQFVGRQVYLRIIVQDTGVGMRDHEKRNLFRRFAQASPRTHIQYGGSGLGLYISKMLSELQGGAIGLKMGDGRGTTFAFYVSARQPEERPTVNVVPQVPSPISKISERSVLTRTPIIVPTSTAVKHDLTSSDHTLLVVEDNLINQRIMCRQLRKHGFTVYSANHGAEALTFLEQTRYWIGRGQTGKPLSVVLLDSEMPVMDGLTCIRRIRQLEASGKLTGHIPVISVTANARSEQVEEARKAGMDDHISKPFQIADLVPKIELLLRSTKADAKEGVNRT